MALFMTDKPNGRYHEQQVQYAREQEAAGNWVKGGHKNDQTMLNADPLFQNLSKGEAIKKRQADFGYGSNNSAEANADIQRSDDIGQEYSRRFGEAAGVAEGRANAANKRGTDMYGADMGQFNTGLANAADSRGKQAGSYDALMGFANQGPGPSAAQAQLTQATDANTQNALAMARSGRGMGGSQAALRSALGANANTQQQSAAQMAQLRANENTAYQAQRLNALNAGGGLATGMAGTDQGFAAHGLAGSQYQTDTRLKGTQLNDTTAQGWAGQQQNATQAGLAAEMGAETQKQNINASALAGRENEYASANTTNATEHGLAVQQGIADANRQQAYVAGGVSAAGALMSDERQKKNIRPLSTWGSGDDEDEGPDASDKAGAALKAFGDSVQGKKGGPTVRSTWGTGDDEYASAVVERAKRADPSKSRTSIREAAGGKFDPISQGSDMVRGEDSSYTFGDQIGRAESWQRSDRKTGPHTSINPENNPSLVRSDERSKQDINPLGTPPTAGAPPRMGEASDAGFNPIGPINPIIATPPPILGGPKPGDKQPDGSVAGKPGGPSLAQQEEVKDEKKGQTGAAVGKTAGSVAGGVAGTAVGGPVGGAIGSFFGGMIGSAAGKTIGKATSDVRSKREIQPLVDSPEAVSKYANASPKALGKFSRSDHPILSEGDSLLGEEGGPLAESSRRIPGYAYDYKHPDEPGAKPGRQVGPMAQDLAANPLTRGTVVKDRKGKLGVDTPRLTLYNTATQHAQQNQLDALDSKIDELTGLIKRKPGDQQATDYSSFSRGTAGL